MNLVKLAHIIWKDHLRPGMNVIDATAGNGHDTLFLAERVLTDFSGSVHAFDVQQSAIDATQDRLKNKLTLHQMDRVFLYHSSHEFFPVNLTQIDLIAYNLGYRPTGDKSITTLAPTTLNSCQNALEILSSKGLLSILIYPAHPQGFEERDALFIWFSTLDSNKNYISIHSPYNRPNSPILAIIYKV